MGDDGFTLIEMLMSVFVIGLLVTLISYNLLYEVRADNVSSTSKQIEALLEGARSCALSSGDVSVVSFTADSAVINCGVFNHQYNFDNVNIETNFPSDTAKFDENGVVNQAATIDVCNSSGCKQVTIAVGRSNVEIK